MISRRFFLKATALGLLAPGVATLPVPAASPVPIPAPPIRSGGIVEFYTADGTLLVSVPMAIEPMAGGISLKGSAWIFERSGTATAVLWRLPNGKTLAGMAGIGRDDDFHLDTPHLTLGGMISVDITFTTDGTFRFLDETLSRMARAALEGPG